MAFPDVEHVELDATYPERIRVLAECIHDVCGFRMQRRPRSAVNLGCGEGMLVERLRELGWRAIGLEGSKQAIAQAVPAAKRYVVPFDLRKPAEGPLPSAPGTLQSRPMHRSGRAPRKKIRRHPRGTCRLVRASPWARGVECRRARTTLARARELASSELLACQIRARWVDTGRRENGQATEAHGDEKRAACRGE